MKLEKHYIKDNNLVKTMKIKYQISTGSGETIEPLMMTNEVSDGNYQTLDDDERSRACSMSPDEPCNPLCTEGSYI